MENRTPDPSASDWGPIRFASLIESWSSDYEALLDALVLARWLDGGAAVAALLSISEVRQIRLSWELWEAVRLGDDPNADPTEELRAHIGDEELEWYRSALWGDPAEATECCSTLQVVV